MTAGHWKAGGAPQAIRDDPITESRNRHGKGLITLSEAKLVALNRALLVWLSDRPLKRQIASKEGFGRIPTHCTFNFVLETP